MPRISIDPKFKVYAEDRKSNAGRPTDYKPEYPKQAFKLALLGLTDKEIADFFGVIPQTLYNWQNTHVEFLEALNKGKLPADANVARQFYKRAVGFSKESVKIFMPAGADEPVYAPYMEYYPPDVGAAKSWLSNRQRGRWAERVEHTGADGGPIVNTNLNVAVSDPTEAAKVYAKMMAG